MPDSFDFSRRSKQDNDFFSQIPTITILVCIACFITTFAHYTAGNVPGENLWNRIGNSVGGTVQQIWNGHYEWLFTDNFLHANPMNGLGFLHLLFNMYWLWRFGSVLELTMNPLAYLLFVMGSMFVSSTSEMAISGSSGIGMSGVVYAMVGLMWAGRGSHPSWRSLVTKEIFQFFLIFGGLCIITTYTHIQPIANGAHFGGLLFGLSTGAICYAPRKRLLWLVPLLLLLTIDVLSVTWMPWSAKWTVWKGEKSLEQHHYSQAIKWYETSIRYGGSRSECYDGISKAWAQIALEARQKGDSSTADRAADQANKASEDADQSTQ